MTRYLLSRVGQAALVLWVAYTATFLLLSALPGDGIMIKFESPEAGLSAEQITLIREYYKVDSPLLIQYLHAALGALKGEFGYSIVNAQPVSERLAAALPQTVALGLTAFALAVALAAVIALVSRFARLGWLRGAVESLPSLLASLPVFWLGLILIQVFSFELGWIPIIGASSGQALILPAVAVAVAISAPLAQVFIRSLDQVDASPFIQVVRAKGASAWWTLTRHSVKNALLPTATIAGLLLGELIAGAVVTETVFGRNGLGRLVTDSVEAQDLPVIQAVVLLAAAAFVTINLVVDLLYPVLDPRLRRTGARRSAAPPGSRPARPTEPAPPPVHEEQTPVRPEAKVEVAVP
ncbi:MAG: ABC transporter permease [Bifidobacteriaceae bacterium]|jgi:peptide/nickel transport system permease protein|nr:ABC transporter permease [Bifidobacteriaceae bacterium]